MQDGTVRFIDELATVPAADPLVVDIGGVLVEIRVERPIPSVEEWLTALPPRSAPPSASIHVGADVEPPTGACDSVNGPVRIWRRPRATVLTSGGCRASVDAQGFTIDAALGAGPTAVLPVLQVALSYLHAARSSLLLHSAAVVIDGGALVLLGGS